MNVRAATNIYVEIVCVSALRGAVLQKLVSGLMEKVP